MIAVKADEDEEKIFSTVMAMMTMMKMTTMMMMVMILSFNDD